MHNDLLRLKKLYDGGSNIIEYLKNTSHDAIDSSLAIAISYDLQAGSYIKKAKENPKYEEERALVYSNIINQLGPYETVLEAGVGEGTTLGSILPRLNNSVVSAGFDISYSRIKYAKSFLTDVGVFNTKLYMGDLFHSPFKDSSIDIVYTNHTLEPNGGSENEALQELYRITKNYLVLFEPIYELANNNSKKHMDKHSYVKSLYSSALELGYKVIEYKLIFGDNPNSHNNTGVMIIEKSSIYTVTEEANIKLACPVSKNPLESFSDSFYCRESMLLYPVINKIPCLLPGNAIIATHFLDIIETNTSNSDLYNDKL